MSAFPEFEKHRYSRYQGDEADTQNSNIEPATQHKVEQLEERTERKPALRKKKKSSTRGQFKEASTACQIKLPTDLLQSIRLQAVSQGRTISDIILDCLTSEQMVSFTWISSNREAEKAKNDAA